MFKKKKKQYKEDLANEAASESGQEGKKRPKKKKEGYSFDDLGLAVPEVHVNRAQNDMEYIEEILEEEEAEEESFIETENLAFPEIHLSKLRKK